MYSTLFISVTQSLAIAFRHTLKSGIETSQSQSYATTDGLSAALAWCQAPIWGLRPDFYYCQTVACLLMWGAFSDERTGLSFTIAAGPRQRCHSWVQVPRDSWPYFTVSDSRLPQPGGPGSRIYIPQEEGDPVIPPGTGLSKLKQPYTSHLLMYYTRIYKAPSLTAYEISLPWFFGFVFCSVLILWHGNKLNCRCLEMYQ
jgi:hypothetical protein